MKKILLSILAIFMGGMMLITPVFADCPDGCVPTAILGENGCSCDKGDGSSIINILSMVVNVMTVGIGILAVIGIAYSGTQYLTAKGNEEQVKKTKRRIAEIVLGLAAYVTVYALLSWLLPGFN